MTHITDPDESGIAMPVDAATLADVARAKIHQRFRHAYKPPRPATRTIHCAIWRIR